MKKLPFIFAAAGIALTVFGCTTKGTGQWFEVVSPQEAEEYLKTQSDGSLCSHINAFSKPGETDRAALIRFEGEARKRSGLSGAELRSACSPIMSMDAIERYRADEQARCVALAWETLPPLMETRYRDKQIDGPCESWSSTVSGNTVSSRCSYHSTITIQQPYQVDANEDPREGQAKSCLANSSKMRQYNDELASFRFKEARGSR